MHQGNIELFSHLGGLQEILLEIFSSNMDYGNMRKSETARFRPISNSNARQLEVRRISEPGGNSRAAYARSQSTSALSSTLIATDDGRKGKNRKNGKETDKVRRSLFSSPTFGSPNKNVPSTSGIAQKAVSKFYITFNCCYVIDLLRNIFFSVN